MALNWTRNRANQRRADSRRAEVDAAAYTADLTRASIAAAPPAPKRPKLAEPIVIAKFWKNRGGEALIVQIREYHERILFDVRVHYTKDGRLLPSGKGVAVSVLKLPELKRALDKAVKVAIERGLLEPAVAGDGG